MKNAQRQFRVGDVITWGSGAPRARIEAFCESPDGPEAAVQLVEPTSGPCGRSFPVGTPATFPLNQLRPVH